MRDAWAGWRSPAGRLAEAWANPGSVTGLRPEDRRLLGRLSSEPGVVCECWQAATGELIAAGSVIGTRSDFAALMLTDSVCCPDLGLSTGMAVAAAEVAVAGASSPRAAARRLCDRLYGTCRPDQGDVWRAAGSKVPAFVWQSRVYIL